MQAKQKRNQQALARTQKAITALEGYLTSIRAENISADQLKTAMETYDANAETLDGRVTELEQDIKLTGELIQAELTKRVRRPRNSKLNLKATIGVFADVEKEISIAFVYGEYKDCIVKYITSELCFPSGYSSDMDRWLRYTR